MANPALSRTIKTSSPDISEPVETIKRERTMKLAGVLAGMGLLVGGLFAVPYLDFRQGFDPGPSDGAPAYVPDRGSDQAADTDTTPSTAEQAPSMPQDTTGVDQAAPADNGERGAPAADTPSQAPRDTRGE